MFLCRGTSCAVELRTSMFSDSGDRQHAPCFPSSASSGGRSSKSSKRSGSQLQHAFLNRQSNTYVSRTPKRKQLWQVTKLCRCQQHLITVDPPRAGSKPASVLAVLGQFRDAWRAHAEVSSHVDRFFSSTRGSLICLLSNGTKKAGPTNLRQLSSVSM